MNLFSFNNHVSEVCVRFSVAVADSKKTHAAGPLLVSQLCIIINLLLVYYVPVWRARAHVSWLDSHLTRCSPWCRQQQNDQNFSVRGTRTRKNHRSNRTRQLYTFLIPFTLIYYRSPTFNSFSLFKFYYIQFLFPICVCENAPTDIMFVY